MTELETKIYISLSTRSRRALKKTKSRFSKKPRNYWPRSDLIQRLTQQFFITEAEAYTAMLNIRQEVLREQNRGF
ncbi:hypothetical protein MiSe_93960 [Microseira wollei NIES-4236]|uniref:Uncharacterized protein n=1 Tax=Microseira wollei NIES-4236 TaxID=2530354 RepID=A0AAV3XS53_9CYAN|nr:hypothetical protein MiSe_93960 [Microseira wollei NIES-4236]